MMQPVSASKLEIPFDAIVLAAGKGTRFKGETPKVLHPILGISALGRVLKTLSEAGCRRAIVVIGHQSEKIESEINHLQPRWTHMNIQTVLQSPQRGTGDAVRQVRDQIPDLRPTVLVLAGDVPLLRSETLLSLVHHHTTQDAHLTLLGATVENPTGYGRLILNPSEPSGQLQAIIEESDAGESQKKIQYVNTGVYALHWPVCTPMLSTLSAATGQGEYYLTDLVGIALTHGHRVACQWLTDATEMIGINTRAHIAEAVHALSHRQIQALMQAGVTILSTAQTLIAPEVRIGADTVIYPGCVLEGEVTVGSGCELGPNTQLIGPVRIEDNVRISHSVVSDSVIAKGAYIGPYAHIRGGSAVGMDTRVGNFVELKNVQMGNASAAAHLSYLGDAHIGDRVNMGAGSITANYDPVRDVKHLTHIEDGAKVGCNSVLIAPVAVGRNSCVAAGSVITKTVEAGDLAISRGKQTVLPQWVIKHESPTALFRADCQP
ncbi:MAG: bifunctional UDP-N-acetylglucosamine diphosphorylase/glucosamine-1-phosphate N-acetyltransferase GlmU [Vampirovibrionales bacterium]|nr:bifunctional UDP-N-acetylglucosamine diphosphorylase/glucosamine-1-phosphate N-acetyltransferase GlmU [Vampirovibrionales bacterium]